MSYPINMKFGINQVKGNMETDGNDSDLISFVDFNDTGEFLATGDKAGRVVIFRREDDKNKSSRYIVYCTFTSHDPEFDYLKSLEIEEKINCIRWVPQINYARFLLTTNDKTIKLWKTTERTKRTVHDGFITSEENKKSFSNDDLRIPKVEDIDLVVDTTVKRVFSNAHTYHINSLSVNSDQETFLSADDLRINLWNLQITDQSFNIVDLKPPNMEDLVEVITAAKFHPSSCSTFVYSSSRGTIRLCDMRTKALCDEYSMLFEETDDPSNHNFFSEIINSISDLNFDHSGRYLLTRDYLTCKVWDLNMPKGPVETYHVHDFFRNKLCVLYENDSIFDKFEAKWSHNDKYILTGSYNYFFHVFERNTGNSVLLESSREVMKQKLPSLIPRKVVSGDYPNKFNLDSNQVTQEIDVETMDLDHKLMHLSWHPKEPILALAGTSNLYLIDGFEEPCSEAGDLKKDGEIVKVVENMETEPVNS